MRRQKPADSSLSRAPLRLRTGLLLTRCLVLLILLALGALPALAQFSGAGSGTQADPYLVTTVAQLNEVRNNLAGHYLLMNDLDLSGTPENDEAGDGWEPIGTEAAPFLKVFNGGGYTISGLFINKPGTDNVGLFGYVGHGGILREINVSGAVTGQKSVGLLVGTKDGSGGISRCSSAGTVTGTSQEGYAGGLAGRMTGTSATHTNDLQIGRVFESYSTASVDGAGHAGGLVGFSFGGISRSYTTGSVHAGGFAGGIMAAGGRYGSIFDSYSRGSVTCLCNLPFSGISQGFAGLIAGYVSGVGSVVRSNYATGLLTGRERHTGTIVGFQGGGTVVMNNFWDVETTGVPNSSSNGGKTTVEMKTLATFTDRDTPGLSTPWDFVGTPNDDTGTRDYWVLDPNLNDGYPSLIWSAEVSPLPVELVAFTAVRDGSAVLLQWQTAGETNNAGFDVEWKPRGTEAWTRLDFVAGHGTTTVPQAYRHRVEGLAPGTHRFRLRQIDFDGAFEFSPEVEVSVELAETHHLSEAYPNPFNPQASFTLAVAQQQRVAVSVYDVWGRRVAVLFDRVLPASEAQLFVLDGTGWPSGSYVIRAEGERFAATRTVTLLK